MNFQKSGKQLKKGDAILAQMRGYDPWPAKIVDFIGSKKTIKCYFYGSHNTGPVGVKHVIPFTESLETVRLILLRNRIDFSKGIERNRN